MAQATRSAAHSATNATTINITNTGFDPAVVTVDTGEAVVWINQTTRVQQVVGGAPYRVFLPLVVRAFKGNVAAQAAVDTQSATQSPSWGSGAIQPGGRYTHTFTTTGDYPYLLSGSPDITGLVQVSEPQQPPDFDLGIAPVSQRVIQGQSVGYTLTLTGTHGFNTPVTLGVTGLPTGANASWQTNPLVPNGSSVLTITTLSNTPVGSYTVTINASGGGLSHTAQVTLQVDPAPSFTLSVDPGIRTVAQGKNVGYTVAVTALHGFSEAVSLAVADLPAGATVAWSHNPLVPTNTAVMTITTALNTPTGDHSLNVRATGGDIVQQVAVTLTVTPHPDFVLSIEPEAQTTVQNESVAYTVHLTSEHNFTAPVSLSLEGLPTGSTATWSGNPVAPSGTTVLTITTTSQTPIGDHVLELTGVGDGLTHSASALLSVSLHPGFTLAITPAEQSVFQGQLAVYATTITGLYDFTEPVQLTLSGLPAGVTAAIAPNPVTPSGTAAITLTTALTAPLGTHALTLTGTGGGRSHNIPFTLVVTPHPDFTIGIQPPTRTVTQAHSVTYTVALAPEHGFAAPVTLSVSGLPSGATASWSANPNVPPANVTLTITAGSQTPTGNYTLLVTGTGGGFVHTTSAELSITLHDGFTLAIAPDTRSVPQGQRAVYTATVTGLYDFTEPVQLTLSGLPAGVTAAIAPNPVTPSGTAAITLTTALTAPLGTHALTLTGTGGGRSHNIPFTLVVTPHPDFTIGIQPPTRTVTQAHSVTYTVALAPEHGFAAPVTLSVSGLPSGATASWSANPNVPPANVTLTITAGSQTPTGNYTLLVTGTGGGFVHTTSAELSITLHDGFTLAIDPDTRSVPQGQRAVYTATVTGLYDFTEPVQLTLSGLPAGVLAVIAPNPVAPSGTAAITLTTALTAPLGTHALTLAGTGGGRSHTSPLTLTITPHPDFAMVAEPITGTVRQSRIATTLINIAALHGFAAPVTLTVSGLPNGVAPDWSTNPIVPDGSSVLTLTTALTAPLGLYPLAITGSGGGFVHTAPFTLTVLEHPDFVFSIAPPTQAITQGLSVTFTAQLTGDNDWSDPVLLELEDLPSGATASWSANPVVPDGTSTLTITPALSTPPGVYSLWAVADGGLISYTVPLTLTVLAIPEPDLVIEQITTAPVVPTANAPFTLTVSVRNLGGKAVTETFRVDWYADPATPPLTTTIGTGYWLQDGLAPGAGVEFTATHTLFSVGEHSLWAQVDRMNAAAESDETNNLTGPVTVTVGLPDLHIPAITVMPSLLRENAPFSVTVQVRNQGIVGARGPFQVDWYEHLFTAPMSTTTGTISWTLGSLVSGATEVLTTTHTFSDVGIHRFWAQVDRQGQVSETNENNNVTGPQLVFVDRGIPTPTPMWTPTPVPTLNPTPIPGPISPTVLIQSNITANVTWTANNVYVVVGQVTVNAGVVLTIEPGTVVKFQQQTVSPYNKGKLLINGQLWAQGTAARPIVFTSIHDDAYGGDTNRNGGATWPKAGDWDGLLFGSSAGGSVLGHGIVAYGGADGNVAVNGAAVTLTHAVIRDSNTSGLRWMNSASGQVTDNEIHSNLLHGLYLTAGSSPEVGGNTLFRNRNYAVYMQGNCLPTFSNNTAYGNAYNGIGVYGSLGTGTWHSDLPYLATENLALESGSTLTLQPGAVVKFFSQKTLIIRGTLVASGTTTSPIVFTSLKDDQYGGDTQQDGGATKPVPADWGTLYFADTSVDADTILNHVVVRYGGYGYNYGTGTAYANITLDTAGPRILNSFIESSNRYGLQLLNASLPIIESNVIWENGDSGLWLSAASSPQVIDNALVRNTGYAVYMSGGSRATFSGNVAAGNRFNGVGVGGTINVDNTWSDNLPYIIDSSLTLAMNTVLTLQPGVVVKFPAAGQMTINGQLLAQGTAERRIIFTSLKDDAMGGDTNNDAGTTIPARGDWQALRLASTAGSSALHYVTLRYGGSSSTTGALFLDGSAPTLEHLIVMGSQYRGLYVQNASPYVQNAVLTENAIGVYNGTAAYMVINDSAIYGNSQHGLYNANTSYTVNATNNWWGSDTGPSHASNPGGTGDVVTDRVTYTPWRAVSSVTIPTPLPTLPTPPTPTQVSGAITADTTWTAANSPYIVTGDVTVNAGVRLIIEPGVVVKFNATRSLIINGILDAQGVADNRIVFTSIKDDSVGGDSNGDGAASWPAPGNWGRIAFNDSSVDTLTKLRFVEVRYGGSTGSALYVDAASPTIEDNVIKQNSGYGVQALNSSNPSLRRNWILDNTSDGVRLASTSAPTIADNTLWGNGGYAVYMDATCYPTFSGNSAHYNAVNGVRVSGSVTFNQTWYADLVYVVEGGLTVNAGPALTLQPGTVVKFKDTTSYLTVNGALIADGTAAAPIVFTSLRDDAYGGDTDNDDGIFWPTAGDWQRISFADSSDDSRCVLDYVQVRYGGVTNNHSVLLDSAAPRITNSMIAYGQGHGLYLNDQAGPLLQGNLFLQNTTSGLYMQNTSAPNLQNNIFRRNGAYAAEMTADCKPSFSGNVAEDNAFNGVKVSGTVAGATTWGADLVYVAHAVTIPSNGSLTLSPGAIVKFYTGSNWTVNGPLIAEGAESAPIILTSLRDDEYGGDTNNDGDASLPSAGYWGTLTIGSTASASRFEYVVVRYGGDPAIKVSTSTLNVANSTLEYNKRMLWYENSTGVITATSFLSNTNYGLYETGSGLTVQNNTFLGNKWGAYVTTATSSHAVITGNTFTDNYGYAIYFDFASYFYLDNNNSFLYPGMIGNAIRVQGGTLAQNTTLVSNAVYWLDSWSVSTGVTLTVPANTIIKFSSGSLLTVAGTLNGQGTAGSPVVFTSYKDDSVGGDTNADGTASAPAKSDWAAIYINNGTVNLDYAVVRYAGGSYYQGAITQQYCSYGCETYNATVSINHSTLSDNGKPAVYLGSATGVSGSLSLLNSTVQNNSGNGVYVGAGFPVTIDNCVISGNTSSGVQFYYSASPIALTNSILNNNNNYAAEFRLSSGNALTLSGNQGSSNLHNAIYMYGTFNDLTLAPQGSLVYQFSTVTIPSGKTLSLQPGAIVKLSGSLLTVAGTLNGQGTAGNPVVFTSYKDDSVGGDTNADGTASAPAKSDWAAIFINNGTVNLDYAVVRYAGGSYYQGAITQQYCSYGCETYNATVSINHSTLSDNGKPAVYLGSATGVSASAIVNNSSIYGNTSYGIYSSFHPAVVNAENNWWGDASGPAPYGSGNGINYRTYTCGTPPATCYDYEYYVDANPWVGQTAYYGQTIFWNAYVADPVNTATGNYAYQRTDLSIPTRSFPLEFARSYNSTAPQDGRMGYGWTHSYNVTTAETGADGAVIVRHGDGREERFAWNGASYDPPAGTFSTLEKIGGLFHLTLKDQTVYDFDVLGRLSTITDRNGNVTSLTYYGTLLGTVSAPDGRDLVFTYNTDSRLSQIEDPLGRTVGFGYDALADLVVVTDTLGYTTTFTYDTNHRLLTITDANGHTFLNNTYNSDGRVIQQRDAHNNLTAFVYDIPNRRTTVTDPLGRVTAYQYDAELRLISETDALGHSESYTYDADNNRTQVVDKRGNSTAYAYDGRGNALVITDTLGYSTTMTYDLRNNPLSITDGRGNATHYTYDTHSNLIQRQDALNNITIWSYNSYGQLITTTDARGYVTQYTYNLRGDQTSVTDALGNTTTFTYDIVGRQLSQTDALGRVTTFIYDAANRILTINEPLGKVTTYTYDPVGNRLSITDPRGGVTRYTYDEKDRPVTVTDPLSHTITYGYDAVNNQTSITDPLGHTTTYSYDALYRRSTISDPLGHVTSYTYDAGGNRTSLIDANGNVTRYGYDALNRLVSVIDAENGQVTYSYDATGNRAAMTDANGRITLYTYDVLNRLVTESNPLGNVNSYTYDAVGNRINRTKPDGTVITYTYDALNRISVLGYPGAAISYAYNAVSQRIAMTDTVGLTTYVYDELNRLTHTTGPMGILNYSYDLNDNRTSVVYPGNKLVNYTYDLANRLISVTDWDNRATTYVYDEANRQTLVTYPNGIEASYTYDNADRLLSVTHTDPGVGASAAFAYTLDNVGNRLTMQDEDGLTNYVYDDLYRLRQVTYPDSEQVLYSYDPMGNRTAMTSTVSGAITYTYDAGGRLLAAGPLTFAWDANGNLLSKGTSFYTFDSLDRLISAVGDGNAVQFQYDGDGARLRKTVNGAAVDYLQDTGAPLPMVLVETQAGQSSRYVYGNDLILLEDPAGDASYYHGDGLGSTRALSNDAAQRTDAYSYDVFGALRTHTGGSSQSFTFAGEQMDDELGLVYLRARHYDPQVGRFISSDSFPGSDLLTQTWNEYSYTQNNPAVFTDPDGHFWNFVAGAGAGVLEYTVKVAVQNTLEGKPLSQALNGWDPVQAGISGAKGAISYGLGLGPVGRAVVSGVADAAGSAVRQYQTTGSVDIGRALSEGVVGGVISYGVARVVNISPPGVPGALPSGRYAQTALLGAHAQREYAMAVFRGAIRGPIKSQLKSFFFPTPVYASQTNYNVIYGSSAWISSSGMPYHSGDTGLPSAGK